MENLCRNWPALNKHKAAKTFRRIRLTMLAVLLAVMQCYAVSGDAEAAKVNVQQQQQVSGTITDENGEPLPGVTVVIKGTTQGTVSNFDGEYTLTDVPSGATLVFSFVGMRSQEIVVGNRTNINVSMESETIGL